MFDYSNNHKLKNYSFFLYRLLIILEIVRALNYNILRNVYKIKMNNLKMNPIKMYTCFVTLFFFINFILFMWFDKVINSFSIVLNLDFPNNTIVNGVYG